MRLKGRLVLDSVWYNTIRRAPKVVQAELRRALRRAANAVRRRARSRVSKGTGGRHPENLRKSLRVRVRRLAGFVFSSLWYARVQEEGSGYLPGGVIKPKRRKWLHFQAPDGKWVKTASVRVKGQFYLQGGLEESEADIQTAVDDAGKEVAKKLFGG